MITSNEFEIKWCYSIDEIGIDVWTEIFGSSIIKGFNFFKAMEEAKFDTIKQYYLVISKKNRTLAIIPCFTYEMDLLDLLTNKTFKGIVSKVRRVQKHFFKIKTFVIGSYVATVEDFVGIRRDLPDAEYNNICELVNNNIYKMGKQKKCSLTFIKDIRNSRISFVKESFKSYSFFSSFPSNLIPVCDICKPYPIALKKKNRKRYRKYKDLFDNEFSWEIVYDFKDYVNIFTQLYSNVLNVAKNKFETLNKSFFYHLNYQIPEKSFMLICRDKKETIRVMELVIIEEDRLLPIYLGINYMDDDTKVLYLNTIFKTINIAECMGKELIDLGQTSYYPKVMSGAFVENLYYGFYSHKFIVRFIIRNYFSSIFAPIEIPANVYLDSVKNEVISFIREKKIFPMN